MLQWHFPFPLIHNLCPFPLSKRKHFTFNMTLNHLNMHKHVISGICMKEKIKAQSVMTGRSGIKVPLGNADTATFAQHSPLPCNPLCGLPAALVVQKQKAVVSGATQLAAGTILALTGEGGCFLSTAAKSTSLYSFPGWLSMCCLILFSVQKWKSTGFVTWPPALFTGCPEEK